MEINVDFNQQQMTRLVNQYLDLPEDQAMPVSVVYIHAWGDYWENPAQFEQDFLATPIDHAVVIHLRFEGLSLRASGIYDCVQKMIAQTQRKNETVFVFTPNNIEHDHSPWVNLFYNGFATITDEIYRAQTYSQPLATVDLDTCKTWALFVGRRTMPRMLGLWHMTHCDELKDDCLVSLMQELMPAVSPMWMFDHRHYDLVSRWHKPGIIFDLAQTLHWIKHCPLTSIDNVNVKDQYKGLGSDNRNFDLVSRILDLKSQYLFEITFETMTEGLTFTPSEKTVRAIMAGKPQFVYAAPNFLQHMKQLGFRTFEHVWDETYDQLSGPARFAAMFAEIKRIAALSRDDKILLWQQAKPVCEHNKAVLDMLIHQHYENLCK